MRDLSMMISLAGLSVLTSAQAGTQTVLSVFLPDTEAQPLVGSLIAMDPSLTTIAVGCPTPIDKTNCTYPEPLTVTIGPTTFHAVGSLESILATIDCNLSGSTSATCREKVTAPPAPGVLTDIDTTQTLGSAEITFFPVTITAGLGNMTVVNATTTWKSTTPSVTTNTVGTSSSSSSNTASQTAIRTSSATRSGVSATATGAAVQHMAGSALRIVANVLLVAIGMSIVA